MNRRKFIVTTGVCSTVGVSGCLDSLTGPQPRVVDMETDYSASGAILQPEEDTTFEILVVNEGERGEVRVVLTFYTEEDHVVDRHSKTVEMMSDEQRRVEFEVDVPGDADEFAGGAEPA